MVAREEENVQNTIPQHPAFPKHLVLPEVLLLTYYIFVIPHSCCILHDNVVQQILTETKQKLGRLFPLNH